MLISAMWEALERRGSGRLEGLVGPSAAYIEQVAIDYGRHQVGWLHPGLPAPQFNLTSSTTSRPGSTCTSPI
eukprot:8024797-Lingulodinium_polyedra.AAC.1